MSRGPTLRARRRAGGAPVDKRAVFAAHPLFGALPAADIERIAGYARVERFRRGATIFHKDDPGAGLMAVLAGQVRISVPSAEGKEAVLKETLNKSYTTRAGI